MDPQPPTPSPTPPNSPQSTSPQPLPSSGLSNFDVAKIYPQPGTVPTTLAAEPDNIDKSGTDSRIIVLPVLILTTLISLYYFWEYELDNLKFVLASNAKAQFQAVTLLRLIVIVLELYFAFRILNMSNSSRKRLISLALLVIVISGIFSARLLQDQRSADKALDLSIQQDVRNEGRFFGQSAEYIQEQIEHDKQIDPFKKSTDKIYNYQYHQLVLALGLSAVQLTYLMLPPVKKRFH